MLPYQNLLDRFAEESRRILGKNLVGVYLHGSAAMGCFHPSTGDLDLLVVVNEPIPNETKMEYMKMSVFLNKEAPKKGIELSVLRKCFCNPFVYPTPFELHFSPSHLDRWNADPEEYIRNFNGLDRDIAAHVMILRNRGVVLSGSPIRETFGEVRQEDYFSSILHDIENAKEDILHDPMYVILNLCRVLAYRKNGAILSKEEGGQWGLSNLPETYRSLLAAALSQYRGNSVPSYGRNLSEDFASFMLRKICSKP